MARSKDIASKRTYRHLSYPLILLTALLQVHALPHHPPATPFSSRALLHGTGIVGETCHGLNLTTAGIALTDASLLAHAALDATSNFTSPPFSAFFPPDLHTANIVADVFARTIRSLGGSGPRIGILCEDTFDRCNPQANGGIPAYSAQPTMPNQPPLIILCAPGLSLSPNPRPCTKQPGGIHLGWVMLEQLVHLKLISGPDLDIEVQGLAGGDITAASVMNAVKTGRNTTTDARAYAYLGGWARDLGLGAGEEQAPCLENFAFGARYATSDVVGNLPVRPPATQRPH